MNVVDWVIIGIVGISVLFGLYRGFVASVLNMGGGLISFVASFALYPKLAALIQNNQNLLQTLTHYTNSDSRVGDLQLSLTRVVDLGSEGIRQVLEKVDLPAPLDAILQQNLENLAYGTQGAVQNVAQYVEQTILKSSINIICFLVCFLLLFIAISILGNVIRAVFRFPVLKQMDSIAGGCFGVLRGVLLCLALFTVVPLVQTVLPLEMIDKLLAESTLAPIFMNGSLVTAIMNGSLF